MSADAQTYAEILSDFIEDPPRAAEVVGRGRPVALGVLAFLSAGVSVFLAQALLRPAGLSAVSGFSLAFHCGWQIVSGFFLAAVLHLLAEASGGGSLRGEASGLFVLLGLSESAWALAVPAALLLRLLAPSAWGARTALFAAIGLATLILKARSVRDNYGMSMGKAWLILLAPILAVSALIAALVLFAVVGAVSAVSHAFLFRSL